MLTDETRLSWPGSLKYFSVKNTLPARPFQVGDSLDFSVAADGGYNGRWRHAIEEGFVSPDLKLTAEGAAYLNALEIEGNWERQKWRYKETGVAPV